MPKLVQASIREDDDITNILFEIRTEEVLVAYRIVHKAMKQMGFKKYDLECQYDGIKSKK